jgi:hypothetical protein
MRIAKMLLVFTAISANFFLLATQPAKPVSIIELIARSERFEGGKVLLTGFLHLEFEGDGLYLHAEDYRFRMHKNSVWVNIPEELRPLAEKYNDRYVLIVGVYSKKQNGHCGMFSGELSKISSIDLLESNKLSIPNSQ